MESGKRKAPNSAAEKPSKKVKQATLTFSGVAESSSTAVKGVFPNETTRIVSWNVNGLRAAVKKDGFFQFVGRSEYDIMCLNETKLQEPMVAEMSKSFPMFPHQYWNCSKAKKGYSGVALLSKVEPISISYGMGIEKHDMEGRIITAEFDKFFVVATYIPNAGAGLVRLEYRTEEWDVEMRMYLKALETRGKSVIWIGDLNVIHQEIDIHDFQGNQMCAGVTPSERFNFSELLSMGFKDTFRELYPTVRGYSWFSTFNKSARTNNKGWRLDYIVVSESLMPMVKDSLIHKNIYGSDHVPIELILNNTTN